MEQSAQQQQKCTCFSCIQGTYMKIDNFPGHKIKFNKDKELESYRGCWLTTVKSNQKYTTERNTNRKKHNRKKDNTKSTNTQKLNNTFLYKHNQRRKTKSMLN